MVVAQSCTSCLKRSSTASVLHSTWGIEGIQLAILKENVVPLTRIFFSNSVSRTPSATEPVHIYRYTKVRTCMYTMRLTIWKHKLATCYWTIH